MKTTTQSIFGLIITVLLGAAFFGSVSGQSASLVNEQAVKHLRETGEYDSLRAAFDDTRKRRGDEPLTLQVPGTKLVDPVGNDGDKFGNSVSISGNTAIIGSPYADYGKGAAFIFVRSGTTTSWMLQQKLTAYGGAPGDKFGISVGIFSNNGNTVIVGCPGCNGGSGSAYIFIRSGSTWAPQEELTGGGAGERFGISVAISFDAVIVGCPGCNGGKGAAYIYARSGSTWTPQLPILTASDGYAGDLFGSSVAITGNGSRAIVGSPGKNNGQGLAYSFVKSSTGDWTEESYKLIGTSMNQEPNTNCGSSVALHANRAIVGCPGLAGYWVGSAYIFFKTSTSWIQQAQLYDDDEYNEEFGSSVGIYAGTAIVGSPYSNVDPVGTAHIYVSNGTGGWTEQSKLNSYSRSFGASVAINSYTVIVGHPNDVTQFNAKGSAYVFDLRPYVVCNPGTTVSEGNLFPGGFVSFGVSSGPGTVTVDHVNAGTGLQSLTVVGTPTNAEVNIPAFAPGTFAPVVVTFTPIDPELPVDFTLRAASAFHAANIRGRCSAILELPSLE